MKKYLVIIIFISFLSAKLGDKIINKNIIEPITENIEPIKKTEIVKNEPIKKSNEKDLVKVTPIKEKITNNIYVVNIKQGEGFSYNDGHIEYYISTDCWLDKNGKMIDLIYSEYYSYADSSDRKYFLKQEYDKAFKVKKEAEERLNGN